jgi:type 2 lantibiotic biosynthesis protein LanM
MVGDRLSELALHERDGASWLGITGSDRRYISPLGFELYGGLPGVALFLGYLGAVTNNGQYTALARSALATLRSPATMQLPVTRIGAFDGWGGMIYALTHLGVIWHDSGLLSEAESIVTRLPELIERDEHLDLFSGAAGCIVALLVLHSIRPSSAVLGAAVQCGHKLLAHAQPMPGGRTAWKSRYSGQTPLAGIAHGASGIALALMSLAVVSEEPRFRTTALRGIDYESSVFSKPHRNWPDLRVHSESRSEKAAAEYFTSWCGGAPGIGLVRLQLLPCVSGPELRREIDIALEATLSDGFGRNHSLCHGDMGALDFVLTAAETLKQSKWKSETTKLAAAVLRSIEKKGWVCGTPLGVEVPGLMSGIAGVGYELLRLADPYRVPAVTLLAPPTMHLGPPQPT